jgi:hypothetical protein
MGLVDSIAQPGRNATGVAMSRKSYGANGSSLLWSLLAIDPQELLG